MTVTETKTDIDDTLYKLPENSELELGDGLIENLGVTAGDLLDTENMTKKEEEDAALEQIKEKYVFKTSKMLLMTDMSKTMFISSTGWVGCMCAGGGGGG